MFKCTGVCKTCGKCLSENIINSTNQRKTKMFVYPLGYIPDKGGQGFGIAFDIGTTTIVGILTDFSTGKQIDTKAGSNPQNEFGSDVISRITFCSMEDGNLDLLREKTIETLNRIISELCKRNGIREKDIASVVLCGNTTMSHIITGNSPISLAHAPFSPAYTGTVIMDKSRSMLNIGEKAEVMVVPGIAGHLGGDIVSGILAVRLLSMTGLTAFLDIGTNGEIVMTDGNDTFACSTAAGPAFEGASIKYGMRATDGAIEKVEITKGEVFFKTIGSCEPVGICGSGLMDIVSEMLRSGLIDRSGRLLDREKGQEKGLDLGLIARLTKVDNVKQFILVYKENGENIAVTQNDIREVQLAKGAISTGISILSKKFGKKTEDIEKIIVAGAFGNYIDKNSAIRIGLLPEAESERIVFAGNTAGTGASMILASDKETEFMEKIPFCIKHVELAEDKDFQELYLNALSF